MSVRSVIVIGGSAGSYPALLTVTSSLPHTFPACILAALHTPPHTGRGLCAGVRQVSHLPVQLAQDSMALEHGQIYLVPGGRQAHVDHTGLYLRWSNEQDRFRPSIDTLFFTAARTYGGRVIGVVLSGLLEDGAAGLAAIVRAGGVGVIQSPEEAQYAQMPQYALKAAPSSYCLPVKAVAPLLVRLVAASHPLVVSV